jgi:hypothetical protein
MEESGDVSIGVRIGRVGVDDVETAGRDDDGIKGFAVEVSWSAGCLGGGAPNGEKAGALGLSVPVGGRSCLSPEAEAKLAPKTACDISLGNPEGALWEDEKAGDVDAMAAVVGTFDVAAVGLANGELKSDGDAPWPPTWNTAGVDADGGKEEFGFVNPGNSAEPPATFETPCAEGRAEDGAPKSEEEELPNAEPDPKFRLPPKTFGVVLRFANADAVEGAGAETEGPNAEVDDVPKTELAPEVSNMTEGEGRTPKLLVSHSVALGLSGLDWCCVSAGSSSSSTTGPSSRRKASSSS